MRSGAFLVWGIGFVAIHLRVGHLDGIRFIEYVEKRQTLENRKGRRITKREGTVREQVFTGKNRNKYPNHVGRFTMRLQWRRSFERT